MRQEFNQEQFLESFFYMNLTADKTNKLSSSETISYIQTKSLVADFKLRKEL